MFFKIPEICQRLFQDLLELIIPYGFSNLRDVASEDTGSETCEDKHSIGIMLAAEVQPPLSPAVYSLHAEGEPVCNDIGALEETDLDSVPSAGTESTTIQLHVELPSPLTPPLHSPLAASELAPNKADSETTDERQNTGAMSPAVNGLLRNTGSTSPSTVGDVYNGSISSSAIGGKYNTIYLASDRAQILVNHESPKISQEVPKALNDATAHAAFHNSDARVDPPRCHPKTRQAILDKIMNWIQGEDTTRKSSVMWLYGPAGSGKTAIAQSIAEQLVELEMLLASYFFGRLDSSRNYSRSLIATIAYQIALRLPDQVRERITDTVNRDPHVFNLSLEAQIKPLIADPLQPLIRTGYFTKKNAARVIIIDGLDECVNREQQVGILRSVSAALQKHHLPILFFIASRPELEIQGVFNSDLFQGVSTRLALDDDYQARVDIKRFLSDKFVEIKRTHLLAKEISIPWPTAETIGDLVEKSSGQFIYASTVIKFVESTRHRPQERLDIILGLCAPQNDMPFAELDTLYRQVFSDVEDWQKVSLVLAFRVLEPNFPHYNQNNIIEALLGLNDGDIRLFFCDLHSIVDLHGEKLAFYHASVPDFLLDESRSLQFYIDPSTGHARLARKFLQFFQNCSSVQQKAMCNLKALSFHIGRAAGSEELERDIRNFDFLRFYDHGFPREAVYSIPEYISAVKESRLPNADMIYRQQNGIFLSHITQELKLYRQKPDLNFLLVCFQEDAGEVFFTGSDHHGPLLDDTLQLPVLTWEGGNYRMILLDIMKDFMLEETYTSAALYFLKVALPRESAMWDVGYALEMPNVLKSLLGGAGRSEELIDYIQNLPWQLMVLEHCGIIDRFDIAIQTYLARMGIPSNQDYASWALYALRKIPEIEDIDGYQSDNLVANCCYLLEKAGRSNELIDYVQYSPLKHILALGQSRNVALDRAIEVYLLRMDIVSIRDYTSFALHGLGKLSELLHQHDKLSTAEGNRLSYLLDQSVYALEKAGPSAELIDLIQQLQTIPRPKIESMNPWSKPEIRLNIQHAFLSYLRRMGLIEQIRTVSSRP